MSDGNQSPGTALGRPPVTVIGLGPMGRAMAASLLRAGHPVTVWNRTVGCADELQSLTAIPSMIGDGLDLARSLEAGEHPGHLSTARMMGATANHIVRTSEKAGVDTRLPAAVEAHYDQAIAAGRGTENWTVLYELLKAGG